MPLSGKNADFLRRIISQEGDILELVKIEGKKKLRYGFTTGSCAAAAAKAAAWMLFSGRDKEEIEIMTPKGVLYTPLIQNIRKQDGAVSCSVTKDGGDDPDVTNGMPVVATVSLRSDHPLFTETHDWEKVQFTRKQTGGITKAEDAGKNRSINAGTAEKQPSDGSPESTETERPRQVFIDGGFGVGRVTKPGLDQPVGNAAINHVPREMITKAVEEVAGIWDIPDPVYVEISLPEGLNLAKKTFNPRFGIMGGISIVGTTGVVEPMSAQALLDTIRVELRQKREMDGDKVIISPGNYGQDFMLRTYGYNLDESVKFSNFVGQTLDMVSELGFKKLLVVGHVGKLIKVAGGIMNTHSHEADCRMELIAACAIRAGADADLAREILECISTEEAVRILIERGICQETMKIAMDRIAENLRRRAGDDVKIDCMMYTNDAGLLAATPGAEDWFKKNQE